MIEEALKNPRDNDRFGIVNWLEADPASIMKHLNAVACIYHGGANSYQKAALWVDRWIAAPLLRSHMTYFFTARD